MGLTGAIVVQVSAVHSHAPSSLEWIAYLAPSLVALAGGIWIMLHMARHHGGSGDDPGDGGGGGGGGGRGPKPPDPRPEADPHWWPEFERQFAAYVRSLPQPAGVKARRTGGRRSSAP